MKKQSKVWSIGHSNRSLNEFIELLKSADIQTVIDCRTKPKSRFWWFGGSALAKSLGDAGVKYEWRGSNVGGLAGNDNYAESLDEFAARAKDGERIVLMCSEGKVEQCHRGTQLTPELEGRGVEVEHLLYERIA